MQKMRRAGVRPLPVAQPGGALARLVWAYDLFEAIAGEVDALADTLRSRIWPRDRTHQR